MPRLTPSAPGRQVYAFIGGAFRPPNHRHWQMISYFSDLVGNNGEVIVVVSNPKSSKYQKDANHAFEDGRTVTTEEAVQVLEIFLEASNKNNITIMESEEPSPVRAIYGMVEDPDTMSDCDVLICCYKDEADFKKWDRLKDRVAESNPTVNVLDYRKYAFRRSYENFAHGISQLQRRIGGTRLSNEEDAMPSFLSKEQLKQCMEIIYHGDYNQEKDQQSSSHDEPKDDQNKEVKESSDEVDFEITFDTYDEFVKEYRYGHKGKTVISSGVDDNGVLRIRIKNNDEDDSITEIIVNNHEIPAENPTEWYADCGVSEQGLFESNNPDNVYADYDGPGGLEDFVADWEGSKPESATKNGDGSFEIVFNPNKTYVCIVKDSGCNSVEELLAKLDVDKEKEFNDPIEFVKMAMVKLLPYIKVSEITKDENGKLTVDTFDKYNQRKRYVVSYKEARDVDWIKSALNIG